MQNEVNLLKKRSYDDANISQIISNAPTFIQKTYMIMTNNKNSKIVSWNDRGDEFIIKNPNLFAEKVLPLHFKHNNFASFVRQLNMYGFHKSKRSNHEHCFSHPYFLRDHPELIIDIKRKTHEHPIRSTVSPTNIGTYPNELSPRDLQIAHTSYNKKPKEIIDVLTPAVVDLTNKYKDVIRRLEHLEQINKDYSAQNSSLINELVKSKEKEQNLEKLMLLAFGYLFSFINQKEIESGVNPADIIGNAKVSDTSSPTPSRSEPVSTNNGNTNATNAKLVLKNNEFGADLRALLSKILAESFQKGGKFPAESEDFDSVSFLNKFNNLAGFKNAAQSAATLHKSAVPSGLNMIEAGRVRKNENDNNSNRGAKVETVESLSDHADDYSGMYKFGNSINERNNSSLPSFLENPNQFYSRKNSTDYPSPLRYGYENDSIPLEIGGPYDDNEVASPHGGWLPTRLPLSRTNSQVSLFNPPDHHFYNFDSNSETDTVRPTEKTATGTPQDIKQSQTKSPINEGKEGNYKRIKYN